MSLIEVGGTLNLEVKFMQIDGDQQRRRRLTMCVLTLMNESMGSERD